MGKSLATEIWEAFRPYAKVLIVDTFVAVSLWLLLAGFRGLTRLVDVGETAGRIIGIIHSGGVVSAYGVLAGFFVWDIWRLKRGEGAEQ